VTKSEDKAGVSDLVDVEDLVANEMPRADAKAISKLDPDIFGDVKVELTATLGRGEMTVSELVNLAGGSVVPLETPLNGLIDLKFKDRIIARGEIVSVGDQFGVRITEIVARK
jgi:flagellar motor switch protein FliN